MPKLCSCFAVLYSVECIFFEPTKHAQQTFSVSLFISLFTRTSSQLEVMGGWFSLQSWTAESMGMDLTLFFFLICSLARSPGGLWIARFYTYVVVGFQSHVRVSHIPSSGIKPWPGQHFFQSRFDAAIALCYILTRTTCLLSFSLIYRVAGKVWQSGVLLTVFWRVVDLPDTCDLRFVHCGLSLEGSGSGSCVF